MAKIISNGGFFNVFYSIYISDEERKLLQTSEEGARLIQKCNNDMREWKRSTLSSLSREVNKEIQRLRSLTNVETRQANLASAEGKKAKGLESYRSRREY